MSVTLVVPVVVTCDHHGCKTEVKVSGKLVEDDSESRSDLNGFLKADFRVPDGWTWRWGQVYCPAHPFGEAKP